jgi:hypothetical protein
MKTVTRQYKVYKFEELPEEAQEKAIQHLSDINVNYKWWDTVEEDAKTIGLNITSFNLYRNQIDGEWIDNAWEAAKAIIENHGDMCETYTDAQNYLKLHDALQPDEYGNVDSEDIDSDFLYTLLQDYLSMLRKEEEYLTSEEAIIETIKDNDFDFTIDGKIFS